MRYYTPVIEHLRAALSRDVGGFLLSIFRPYIDNNVTRPGAQFFEPDLVSRRDRMRNNFVSCMMVQIQSPCGL